MPLTVKTDPTQAPPFSASTVDGASVSLESLTHVGPLVLVFLRGFT